jgi:hypothetical protein
MSVTLSTPLEYFDSLHLYVQSVQITEDYLIIFRVNISPRLVLGSAVTSIQLSRPQAKIISNVGLEVITAVVIKVAIF